MSVDCIHSNLRGRGLKSWWHLVILHPGAKQRKYGKLKLTCEPNNVIRKCKIRYFFKLCQLTSSLNILIKISAMKINLILNRIDVNHCGQAMG
jgi:hypothetical protein